MLSLDIANAVPHASSAVGFQPVTSPYQVIASSRVSKPSVCALGAKSGCELRRSVEKAAIVQGTTRFERSDRGLADRGHFPAVVFR
jgi:hypothetical protein